MAFGRPRSGVWVGVRPLLFPSVRGPMAPCASQGASVLFIKYKRAPKKENEGSVVEPICLILFARKMSSSKNGSPTSVIT